MNIMKKTLLGACAVFACAGVANATEAWDYVDTFPDRGTWALLSNGTLPTSSDDVSPASSTDVYVKPHTRDDGTEVSGYWRSAADDTVNNNFSTEGNVNPYTGEPGTLPREADDSSVSTGTEAQQQEVTTGALSDTLYVRDAVTQDQFDEANAMVLLGTRDAVTQEQFDEANAKVTTGAIASITQATVDTAQGIVTIGERIGVSQAEIDNNTFIVEQIEEIIDAGFIEAAALDVDGDAGDAGDAFATNQAAIENAITTKIQNESDVGGGNTDIAAIVADIITVDADDVSDALKGLSTAVDTATTAADITDKDVKPGTGTAATNFTDATTAAASLVVKDSGTGSGGGTGADVTVDTALLAKDYLADNIGGDAVSIALAQKIIDTDALYSAAVTANNDATKAKMDAQAAVANAVIASLDKSSPESISSRDAAQKIIDIGPLSEITSGDVVSAWRTTVLGVRTEITQEEFDAAKVTVDAGLTVTNASFSLPGMTKVSQELYEYAKAVVKYTEGSLFKESGYSQNDLDNAQDIVNAGALEQITSDQHATATAIVDINNVAEAESLLKEGLTAGVLQSDLDDAQKVVDAQKVLTDVEAAGDADSTNRAAVTQATVDKNAELLNLLTYAREELDISGTIDLSDEQIDLETMQAIIELAEAQILVNAGVLEEQVTAEQIAIAQAIVNGGVRPEVTAEQIAMAQAIVDGGVLAAITQEQVDAQTEERELIVQIFNHGVKVENPTQEQIDAAQAKYNEYAVAYGESSIDAAIGMYSLTNDDIDAILAITNTYDETSVMADVKKFVAAGGIDGVQALVNTGHIETVLGLIKTKALTADQFITKSKPDVSGAVSGATAGVNAVGGAIGGHQQSIVVSSNKYGLKKHSLSVSKQLGVSSGDGIRSTGAWMEVFGSTSEMDMRDSIPGYDADASGLVVGIDKTFGDLMIGAAISVANIDVDGKSIANSTTDSDQYQGTLYGTMMLDSYYISGTLAYAHTSSDTSRIGLDGVVTGSYDTDTYAISLGAGVPIDMGSMAIIPQAVMSYASISPDGYTESGIGALRVNAESMDSFGIKAGVAVVNTFALGSGVVAPQVRLMADWDVTHDKTVVNSSWVGDVDNTVYSTSGAEPGSLGAIIGAGVDYASDDGLYVLSLDYDLSTKSDYTSHAGSVKVRVNF